MKKKESHELISGLQLSRRALVLSGMFGASCGLLLFFYNFDNFSSVGIGLSVFMMSIFYTCSVSTYIIYPAFIRLKTSSVSQDKMNKKPYGMNLVVIIAALFIIILILTGLFFARGDLLRLFPLLDILYFILLLASGIISAKVLKPLMKGFFLSSQNAQPGDKIILKTLIDTYSFLIILAINSGIILTIMKLIVTMVNLDSSRLIYRDMTSAFSINLVAFTIALIFWTVKQKLLFIKKFATEKE